jgi:hypothetical protein
MKIRALTTFLDGRDRFEADDQRTVDDARGHRFVAHGWAVEVGQEPVAVDAQAAADLVIHHAKHKQQGA